MVEQKWRPRNFLCAVPGNSREDSREFLEHRAKEGVWHNSIANICILSDLDNCKWSGPDFCGFAIKKFAIIKKCFLINNNLIQNSGKVLMTI